MARSIKVTKGEFLKQIGKARGQSLVVSELLEALMGIWGGPGKFAKEFHTEFSKAKSGGIIRARMLDSVIRLFVIHTGNLKGSGDNLGSMSEQELRAAVAELLDGQRPDAAEQKGEASPEAAAGDSPSAAADGS